MSIHRLHAYWNVKLLNHVIRLHYFEVAKSRKLTILSFRRRVTRSLIHLTVHASCKTISMYDVSQSHRIEIFISNNPKMISTYHHTKHTTLITAAIADSNHRHLNRSCTMMVCEYRKPSQIAARDICSSTTAI